MEWTPQARIAADALGNGVSVALSALTAGVPKARVVGWMKDEEFAEVVKTTTTHVLKQRRALAQVVWQEGMLSLLKVATEGEEEKNRVAAAHRLVELAGSILEGTVNDRGRSYLRVLFGPREDAALPPPPVESADG